MTDKTETCTGGCTCGEVRYEVHASPMIVHACHCRWCQRQTGGPHVINALIEAEHVVTTKGEVETIDTASPSGKGQIIARCPNCRVAVWSHYDFRGLRERVHFLRVGTLDNPDLMPPDVHIYTSTKMPWYVIPPDHYAVEEFYDLATTWSPESQQRFQALVAAMKAGPG
ncbi:GFA family protein [Hyphobacterium sp. HN65]|uniref:GFA family protein n=1 Tax=Hyphobacterium lacteum TaxID=3116575 RepID=A0ABU7LRF7_9PROT|nr:GFA family protein [Hyphobacterium sp. HN65]MEE2526505.1 GFA family protein [Hyphobacterium sp. HN65]